MNMIELIGIVASIFLLVSMIFRTTSYKGSLFMRIFNLIGSAVFVVYGLLLPAYSTAFLNCILLFINGYYLIELIIKEHKKNIKDKE